MRSLALVGTALAGLLLTAARPAELSAQEECTAKCTCLKDGCGCHSTGGNGASCEAGGSYCAVKRCGTELLPVGFAPDGSAVVRGKPEGQLASYARPGHARVRLVNSGQWERVERDHAVARSCAGLVLAEWYAREQATALRLASTELIL